MMDIAKRKFKITGLSEKLEESTDFQACLAEWLKEESIIPTLTKMYQEPSIILATFLDYQIKNQIIKEVKSKGRLNFKGECIELYLDLPSELCAMNPSQSPNS